MRAYQYFPIAEARDLYAAGRSLREVGEALRVSDTTIGNWLKWAGVVLRPRGGANRRPAMEGTA